MAIIKLYKYKLSCDGFHCENLCVIETETKYSLKNQFYVVPEKHDIPNSWSIVETKISQYSAPLQQLVCQNCFETRNYSR